MSLIEPTVGLAPPPEDQGSERRRALRFGALFAAFFCGAGLWRMHRGASPQPARVLVGVGVALLVYSLVHPRGALALRRQWMRFGAALGRINSVIVLGVLYLAVVTPLGVLLRLFSRRVGSASGGSYFTPRSEQRDAKHFEHPY